MQIKPLKDEYLEDAARMVSDRYKCLRKQVTHLPDCYSDFLSFLPLLQALFKPDVPGVAAFQGKILAGFLTGWQIPEFRGKRSIYSPEWANAALPGDSARIFEAMYSQISGEWFARGHTAHYLSLFPNDQPALQQWHQLGFGMFSVDALRGLDPVPHEQTDVQIRRAEPQDIDRVIALQNELWLYIKKPPIFLLNERYDRAYYEEWLLNSKKAVWLASVQGEPLGFIRMGPADEDVCKIIFEEKTTSVYAAFTVAQARCKGIATALLAHALESARNEGYLRCAVPFEPMNPLGSRFWLRYFQPVCYSLLRVIDDRLTKIPVGD